MSDTIFQKIIDGELPCHRVYENELVLAFLDIAPLAEGHTLLIPKRYARTLTDLDAESAGALGVALPKVAAAVKRVTGADAYNVLQNNEALAGQAVFHVHFHIIPKYAEGSGLGREWQPQKFEHEQGAVLAKRLRAALV